MNGTEHLMMLFLVRGDSGRRCGRCAGPIPSDDRYGTIEAVCSTCRGQIGTPRRPEHRRATISRALRRARRT